MTFPEAAELGWLSFDTFLARSGLVSNPGQVVADSGWQLYAAVTDLVRFLSGSSNPLRSQVVVFAQAPDGWAGGTPVLDIAMDAAAGFDSVADGAMLGDGSEADTLGSFVSLGMEMFDLGSGRYSSVYQVNAGSYNVLLGGDYFASPQLAHDDGYAPDQAFDGSLALGVHHDPGTPGGGVFAGAYFLLAAQVRAAGPTTFPNYPGFERVATTTFSLGDSSFPLALQAGAHRSDFSF